LGKTFWFTADDVERILRKHGFELISQKGSHRKWRSQAQDTQVIVPFHQGRDLPTGTLRNIMVTAMIPEEEWKSP
jgi:predicted RNA binding protein YcfA (HicA-like mRNA interferase family)